MPTNYTNYTNYKKSIANESELLFKEEVYRVIGAAIEVHKTIGCGFLEPVYQESLGIEFGLQQIPFQQQVPITIHYKDRLLEKFYIADFFVFEKIIVEIKAVQQINSEHVAQVINYLKATDIRLGILINFGAKNLEWKRIIN